MYLPLYTVKADGTTGEWLKGTLKRVGQINETQHLTRHDTDAVHYDTCDQDGETIAVEVWWMFAEDD